MAADTGMDTCPSPEITDSRKRPLDVDSENGDVKRSHFSSGKSHRTHPYLDRYYALYAYQPSYRLLIYFIATWLEILQ